LRFADCRKAIRTFTRTCTIFDALFIADGIISSWIYIYHTFMNRYGTHESDYEETWDTH
jgi:hypothetical protein